MELKTPFYFTKKRKNKEVSVTLEYEDGSEVTSVLKKSHLKRGDFKLSEKAFGYYIDEDTGEKIRITNIVGYRDGSFLKWCPHCEKKKALYKFGDAGRETSGKRDQSWCNKCRKKAKKAKKDKTNQISL